MLPRFAIATLIVLTLMTVPMMVDGFGTRAPSPEAPQGLNAVLDQGSVSLSWSPPSNSAESEVTGYVIYRAESPGSENMYTETTSTSYMDNSVDPGKTYYYQVAAKNQDGPGTRSNEVSVPLPVQKYTINGRVTSSGNNNGIGGAHLTFNKQDPPQQSFDANTDGGGSYSIDLPSGNYQVKVDANGYRSREETFFINNPMNRDFNLDGENDNGNGGKDEFNLSKELGIDTDKLQKVATTAAIIGGIVLVSIPVEIFLIMLFVILIFIRLGKVRKELRLRNENDGLFLSKRRKRKFDGSIQKTKPAQGPKKEIEKEKETAKEKKKK